MRKWLINFTSCREEECTENMQRLRERADEELYNAKEDRRGVYLSRVRVIEAKDGRGK